MKFLISKPNTQRNSKPRFGQRASGIGRFQSGFTVIELLVVIFIIGLLTSLVTTNFEKQRQQQEIHAAAADLISKLREVQSNLLGGKVISGGTTAAKAYQIALTPGAATFRIDYNAGAATTTLETVSFSKNTLISQILVGGTPRNPANVYLRAPFGKITVEGSANQNIQIDLRHQTSGQTRSVLIDGISGKVGLQ